MFRVGSVSYSSSSSPSSGVVLGGFDGGGVRLCEIMMSGRSSRYPFTASQWQELEHQALIFKYMASGTPIPHDLILPIRRSFYLDSASTSPTHLFPHQPNIGWGCFQMGFGRKAEDPEPGRCRRTDGKKWRCSKEAYPDSKYCERHMHRGKNRSRKPVEISVATNSTATGAAASSASSATSPNPCALYPPHLAVGAAAEAHHLVYPFAASRHPGVGVPLQSGVPHFQMDTASSSDRDYRYCHGMKEDVDQYAFFSEASGAEREGSWRFTPLGMSSLGEPRQRSYSSLQQGGYLAAADLSRGQERNEEEKRQHCFVLGADFKLDRPAKGEREGEAQRPLRHFFDDWSLKTREPWMESEEQQPGWGGLPMTQLSISIPMAHHDFPATGVQPRSDD